jgi:hypothetical protein
MGKAEINFSAIRDNFNYRRGGNIFSEPSILTPCDPRRIILKVELKIFLSPLNPFVFEKRGTIIGECQYDQKTVFLKFVDTVERIFWQISLLTLIRESQFNADPNPKHKVKI